MPEFLNLLFCASLSKQDVSIFLFTLEFVYVCNVFFFVSLVHFWYCSFHFKSVTLFFFFSNQSSFYALCSDSHFHSPIIFLLPFVHIVSSSLWLSQLSKSKRFWVCVWVPVKCTFVQACCVTCCFSLRAGWPTFLTCCCCFTCSSDVHKPMLW